MNNALELDNSEMMGRQIIVQETKNKTPSNFGNNRQGRNNDQSSNKVFNKFKDQNKGSESTNVIVRNLSFNIEESYL